MAALHALGRRQVSWGGEVRGYSRTLVRGRSFLGFMDSGEEGVNVVPVLSGLGCKYTGLGGCTFSGMTFFLVVSGATPSFMKGVGFRGGWFHGCSLYTLSKTDLIGCLRGGMEWRGVRVSWAVVHRSCP